MKSFGEILKIIRKYSKTDMVGCRYIVNNGGGCEVCPVSKIKNGYFNGVACFELRDELIETLVILERKEKLEKLLS